jgi:ribonuclease P protein component
MTQSSRFTAIQAQEFFSKARRVIRRPELDILLAPALYSAGRLLVVTSKKTGNAPQRNTIRRRLKAIFFKEKLTALGYDCAVIIKPRGISLSSQELSTLLSAAYAKVGISPCNAC